MSRIAYVNGRYSALREARVHVEDRGFQFADGVYEVCEVLGARLVDATRHLDRLDRSLRELRIDKPMARPALLGVLREVVARNRVRDGLVYLQVTRGAARRDFPFPAKGTPPSLVVTARALDPARLAAQAAQGIAVISVPENRWPRVDVKSVALLPNVLAKQQAREAGAQEAWFVDRDGFVTEGASSNAWIVTRDGRVVTRSADSGILRGITRTTLLELLERRNVLLEERPFTVAEALDAAEAFITSATNLIMPVVRVDGRPVGGGEPGPLATLLRRAFHDVAELA
jgi:D-alanine transaminase